MLPLAVTGYPKAKNSQLLLLYPFNAAVWYFLGAAAVSGTVFLLAAALVHKLDPYLEIMFCVSTLFCESLDDKCNKLKFPYSRSIFLMFWLPMVLLLSLAYNSNLRAALFKIGKEKPVDTFEDMLEANLIGYLAQDSYFEWAMKNSPTAIIREAFQKVKKK
jgi:hypothetical protein